MKIILHVCDICRCQRNDLRELTGHWRNLTGCKDICPDCLKEINSIWVQAKAIAMDCSDYHIKRLVADQSSRCEPMTPERGRKKEAK